MAKLPDYFHFRVIPDSKKLTFTIERVEIEEILERFTRKAFWKRCQDDTCYWFECSNCGQAPLYTRYKQEILTDFCPYCGCMMEEKNDVSEGV